MKTEWTNSKDGDRMGITEDAVGNMIVTDENGNFVKMFDYYEDAVMFVNQTLLALVAGRN